VGEEQVSVQGVRSNGRSATPTTRINNSPVTANITRPPTTSMARSRPNVCSTPT